MSSTDKSSKDSGNGSSQADSESQKKIAELEKKVADLQKQLDTANSGGGSQAVVKANAGPVISATEGKSWKGGARFEGGPQHLAMANEAFKWSVELKDKGDDRPFSLIFDQLYMEQRRTVGVAEKDSPPGGYNSSKLMNDVYEKAVELKLKGDDRSMSMIIASLSFAYRRGQIQW